MNLHRIFGLNQGFLTQLELLEDYCKSLQWWLNFDLTAYVSDDRNCGLAEHYMQLAIEVVLDVCRHLVIALELKTPSDSAGLLPALEKAGLLSAEFVKRNNGMAGFRNRLVPVYESIDHELTYDFLQKPLADFQEFIRQISQFVLREEHSTNSGR